MGAKAQPLATGSGGIAGSSTHLLARPADGAVLTGSERVFAAVRDPEGGSIGSRANADHGHSSGSSPAPVRLPAELSEEDTQLGVTYFDRRYPATGIADPIPTPEWTPAPAGIPGPERTRKRWAASA